MAGAAEGVSLHAASIHASTTDRTITCLDSANDRATGGERPSPEKFFFMTECGFCCLCPYPTSRFGPR
jgi:hypothetical protein